MISYSPRAARAIARLKRSYNDVDIFVEDTANRNMWVELIKTIIPDQFRLRSVNQLGGRETVIDACRLDQQDTGRRKLYIIDGDFNALLGRRRPRLKYLYQLKAYCVENILLSEDAVRYVGVVCKPDWTERQVDMIFDYSTWIQKTTSALKSVFISYGLAYKLVPEIQTIKFSVRKLFIHTVDGPAVCPKKGYRRSLDVLRQVRRKLPLRLICEERKKVALRLSSLKLENVISGKDYLFPPFYERMRQKLSFPGNPEQLKVQLARAFKRASEPTLHRRITRSAHSWLIA